jgi:hypothetical protein
MLHRIIALRVERDTHMPQWEYTKLDLNDLPRNTQELEVLNDAGKDGWELVTILNGIAYLKREVPGTAAARSTRRKAATSPDA